VKKRRHDHKDEDEHRFDDDQRRQVAFHA